MTCVQTISRALQYYKQALMLVATLLFAIGAGPVSGQQLANINLLADSIYVDQNSGDLVARGSVQVFYQGTILTAQEIRYNNASNTIAATGPLTITDANGTVLTAEFAQLSKDLQQGLIRGARLLLAHQLQITSAEVNRSAGRFNTLTNAVASACQICGSRPVPVWQIRAEQIIHDEKNKAIYFRNAKFEFYGVPILYSPYLRIPTADVPRATGLLRPVFIASNTLGNGIKLPYYIIFGPSADATITPTIAVQGAALLDFEYRQKFNNGGFQIHAGTSLVDSTGFLKRGYVSSTGSFIVGDEVTLGFDITTVTDNGFLSQYGYNESDRLVSEITASRYRKRSYFALAAAVLNSLRSDENNAKIPLVFPEFRVRQYTTNAVLGSKVGYELSAVGLSRKIGQDVARVGASADWTVPLDLPLGIHATGFARADLNFYRVWNNNTYPNRILTSFYPTIGAELRWPLENTTARTRQVLEPVAQLIYTAKPAFNDVVPNEDSQLAEFDDTNLFELNRYPGRDANETGFRANLGVTYTIYDQTGWEFGLAGGVVLRSNPNTQFSQDLLGTIKLQYADLFSVSNRFLFDQNLNVKRNEALFSITRDKWDVAGTLIYLAPDLLAGSPVERAEASISGAYRISPSWELTSNYTQNLISGTAIKAGAGFTFTNECLHVGFSLSRRFTSSNNVPPVTDMNLVIELAGFGGNALDTWPESRCAY